MTVTAVPGAGLVKPLVQTLAGIQEDLPDFFEPFGIRSSGQGFKPCLGGVNKSEEVRSGLGRKKTLPRHVHVDGRSMRQDMQ